MNPVAHLAWCRLSGSASARVLRAPALGVRQWVVAMSHTPGVLRGLSLQDALLPEPDLAVLIDPLHATGLEVVPPAVGRSVPEARVQAPDYPRMQSAMPATGSREQGVRPGPGHRDGRPGSGAFDTQPEAARVILAEAKRAGGQPARLATLLQRHAGSVAPLRPDVRAGAQAQSGRGTASIRQAIEAATPQRPAADRKVVYLPARAVASAAMPDVLRAGAGPARWEANMAATLNRWAQGGAAPGVRGAEFSPRGAVAGASGRLLPGGIAAMAAPHLPNSVRSDERAAVISWNKPTESAGVPAPATPSAPLAASTAPLEQALRAALPPLAGGTENPPAAAQPVIESLARIVEQLTSIEMKLSQAAQVSAAAAGSSEEAPAVQWLEDDDLAGRLQGILRRQAKRRGIDL